MWKMIAREKTTNVIVITLQNGMIFFTLEQKFYNQDKTFYDHSL